MKKRILVLSEATFLNTGYAIYCKELISGLNKNPNYEVAEYASYAMPACDKDNRILSIPWKVYPSIPHPDNHKQVEEYKSHPVNSWGGYFFERVCLDFKPHVICTIRDYWMDSFVDNSPFRKLFKWIWMPTVDAECQNEQWLDCYSRCDGILTYSDWSGKQLLKETNNKIKWLGGAPPSVSENYKPLDKKNIKKQLGFDENVRIIGTVMRNQRRKLYPDLFEGFRNYLSETKDINTYLYCHTSYPDNNGWDLPYYIKKYNLGNRILFTYVCDKCGYVFPSFFNDTITLCNRCGSIAATLAAVQNGPDNKVMNLIYNLFDLYIQYSNSEGFGVPMVEAAACGVPVMGVNYSAMEDVLMKLDGIPIEVLTKIPELETGCLRAAPNNKDLTKKLVEFFSLSEYERNKKSERTKELQLQHYNPINSIKQWEKCIESLNIQDLWNSPPDIHNIPNGIPPDTISNRDFVKWLIINVLGDSSKLNTYMELRMLRDITFGAASRGIAGMYFNEEANQFAKPQYDQFNRQDAYNTMRNLGERKNHWERIRCGIN